MNKDNLDQDIRLGEIVEKLRKGPQPHLIVCDRTVGGIYENIVTPEKQVPEEPLFIPWETCTTVGEKFSFHYTDTFKSGRELVHLLLDVVSKGGNLALNLAPQPDGELPGRAVASLRDMADGSGCMERASMKPLLQNPFLKEILNIQKKERPYMPFIYMKIMPVFRSAFILRYRIKSAGYG